MSASAKSIDKQVTAATVRITGKRWCSSCFTYHDASTMTPHRQVGGGVIYRCPRWLEARARHRAAMCPT